MRNTLGSEHSGGLVTSGPVGKRPRGHNNLDGDIRGVCAGLSFPAWLTGTRENVVESVKG